MKSFILIWDRMLDMPDLAARFAGKGAVILEPAGRLVVEGDWGWFDIASDPFVLDECEFADLENIQKWMGKDMLALMDEALFWGVSFRTEESAEIAIMGLPVSDTLLVDNDHGLIVPISDIRSRIERRESWIWAKA